MWWGILPYSKISRCGIAAQHGATLATRASEAQTAVWEARSPSLLSEQAPKDRGSSRRMPRRKGKLLAGLFISAKFRPPRKEHGSGPGARDLDALEAG